MTSKERAAVQGLINKMTELEKIREETLEALKDMNEAYGDGHRWCSWKACLDGIIKNTEERSIERGRAEHQYERYLKASGQYELIQSFGQELADLGFWKKK